MGEMDWRAYISTESDGHHHHRHHHSASHRTATPATFTQRHRQQVGESIYARTISQTLYMHEFMFAIYSYI